MMDTGKMKTYRLVAMLALLSAGWAQKAKPYEATHVKVTRSLINEHGVRFIDARSSGLSFTFQCNANQPSCTTPMIGGEYGLTETKPALYECDNYTMIRTGVTTPELILVCLNSVRPD